MTEGVGVGTGAVQVLDLLDKIKRLEAEVERHMREKVALAALVSEERDKVERLRELLREAANEIDELGFPSKADKFLSAIVATEPEL